MRFVHEFKQFVHDRLEKLPMRFQEARVLSHDVHDVGSNDGFVVFPTLRFAQTEQVLNHSDKKSFFVIFRHCSTDAPNCPAQCVQVVPAPFASVYLLRELRKHDRFGIVAIQMREVDKCISHRLVLSDNIRVFGCLADDITVFIFNNQYLFRLGHTRNHHLPDARKDRSVKKLSVLRGSAAIQVQDPPGSVCLLLRLIEGFR
mmetsp:Transcript_37118/g.55295  ORF Transcript_37118/g.55295 Transcript_37118/m.55295 type:complete len:202 (+) Transcript_37118:1581-2186(+)